MTSDLKKYLKGKKVAVLGLGISNRPLIRFIHKFGAKVSGFDRAEADSPEMSALKDELDKEAVKIDWFLGPDYLKGLDQDFDLIFKTPIIRKDLPEIQTAVAKGAELTSEMELFFKFCPCKIIGITGSDGKTTTSTMTAKVLEEAGYKVHLGGNIGKPLVDRLDEIREEDYAVMELSSFQLHSMSQSPHIAIITNISPNHLDVHKDYPEYIEAKKNIFQNQKQGDLLVLFKNDELLASFEDHVKKLGSELRFFGPKGNFAGYDQDYFYFKSGSRLALKEIRVKGNYNLNNYAAVATALYDLCSDEAIIDVMTTFGGVEHRNEFVRTLNGVDYYNSSIDSSPTRTKATLQAFIDSGREVVLIAGGKDKNSDYGGLGAQIGRCCKSVILSGDNAGLIKESIEKEAGSRIKIFEAGNYDEALQIAGREAVFGQVVLLSPAGTSFDRFKNFEERGRVFKNLLNSL